MCTNSARLINSLECYMDELVDCFEDFVKKSLFIISVAVGALILMLGYVLKIVSERSQLTLAGPLTVPGGISSGTATPSGCPQICGSERSSIGSSSSDVKRTRSAAQLPQISVNSVAIPGLKKDDLLKQTTSASANTNPMLDGPSFDEKVLRNIGLSSCSKNCMQNKRSIMRNSSSSKIKIPRKPSPTCIPNHHIATPRQCSKFFVSRNSCCSMCCADDDRR